MPRDLAFFDEVAEVGGELLDALRDRPDAAPFLRRTRDVYQLLVEVHDDVVTTTADVAAARSLEEAESAVRALHGYSLESVFRARRWCDEMEALGRDLRSLPAGVHVRDGETWTEFTDSLARREYEVAALYEDALHEVTDRAAQATELAELQEYMESVSDALVLQKARFDLLAKRAGALARKR